MEQAYSGPECPPGFENWIAEVGPHVTGISLCGTLDYCGVSNAWVGRIEDDQGNSYSHASFSNSTEMVPQTPLMEPTSLLYKDDDKEVIPEEEDLVEARISWDVGKFLGLKVKNDKAMIDALAKVKECQDFVMPRKRGRPRKNKAQK